jgi:hypothetical protein
MKASKPSPKSERQTSKESEGIYPPHAKRGEVARSAGGEPRVGNHRVNLRPRLKREVTFEWQSLQ